MSLEKFGDRRVDPYAYFRNLDDPRVLPHLEAENACFACALQNLKEQVDRLSRRLAALALEDKETYPFEEGPFRYFFRFRKGMNHPQFWRITPQGEEELLLDPNPLEERHPFVDVAQVFPSPDGVFFFYLLDTTGDETHHLHLVESATRRELHRIERDISEAAWLSPRVLLFVEKTPGTRRPFRVWRWNLDREPVVLFEEPDEAFFVNVRRSLDRRFGLVELHSMDTTELWLYAPEDERPRLLLPREKGVEAWGEPRRDELWVRTNRGAPQFRLVRTSLHRPDLDRAEEVIPEDPDVGLMDFLVFDHHVALLARREGLPTVEILSLASGERHRVAFPHPAYDVAFELHTRADTSELRLAYSTPVTPRQTLVYDMETRQLEVRHAPSAPEHDPDRYEVVRLWIPSHDGVKVPATVVRPRHNRKPIPLFLEGYGAYGIPFPLTYRPSAVSLLEQDVAWGAAHVRGGGDLGKRWHEEGKLLKKKNTFLDFIHVAEHLGHLPWVDRERIAIRGGSAGGLLIGAVVNLRPDLFQVALAEVPFVDVLNTMLDPTLPLTVTEYDEWGNPNEETFYRYIRSYSPYDNIQDARFPHIIAVGGLHDPRVRFWEPVKWVARLRDHNQGKGQIFLRMEMQGGHFGPSGRYHRFREMAELLSLVLHLLNTPR